jgi:3-oxoacyl-[acyl-carrier protein] reductase
MRLSGKVAIITGAGAGIGEAIATRFAQEGARLVLADIQPAAGKAVLDKTLAVGAQVVFVESDISKEPSAHRIADAAIESFGGIDILVNNAANFTQIGVEKAEVSDWERVLGVNVIGTALVSKFAIPHMKAKGGSIVNVASMSGVIAQPDFATYNASKGAVITMTKCMALDLAPFNGWD